jgi:hypothetical protein
MDDQQLDSIIKNFNVEITLAPDSDKRTFKTFKEFRDFIQVERTFWGPCAGAHELMQWLNTIENNLANAKNTGNLSQAQTEVGQAVGSVRSKAFIYSGTPHAEIVKSLCAKNTDSAKGALAFFRRLRPDPNTLGNPDFFRGFIRAAIYEEPSILGIEPDKAVIDKLRVEARAAIDRLDSKTNEASLVISDFKTDIDNFKKSTAEESSARIADENRKFDAAIADWEAKLQETNTKWEDQFQATSKLYSEKLRLEGPATYWQKIASSYERKGILWVASALVLGIGVGAAIMRILYDPPKMFDTDKITPGGIRDAILLAFSVSLIVYLMHLFVRLATSAYHLSRDAKEREQLTHVFLALIEGEAIKEEDRAIVLSAIFSRSDTGLLKGDGAPALPGTLGATLDMLRGPSH